MYKRGKCGTPLVTNFLHTRGLRLAFQNFSLKSLSLSLTHTFLSANTFWTEDIEGVQTFLQFKRFLRFTEMFGELFGQSLDV